VVNVTPTPSPTGTLLRLGPGRGARRELVAAGAALLDVGGESTRPGAEPVGGRRRAAARPAGGGGLAADGAVPVSIDTSKALVAGAALRAGATIVNDVTAGLADPDLLGVVADAGAALVVSAHAR